MKPGLLARCCGGLLLLAASGCNQPVSRDGTTPASSLHPGGPGVVRLGAVGPAQREGEILVGYRAGASLASAGERTRRQALHRRQGGESLQEFPRLRLEHVRLAPGVGVEEAIRRYQQDPDVEYAEPNFVVAAHAVAGDPLFGLQWALQNTGQTGGTPGADIKMTQAWDLARGSASVVVAVLDSGIDLGHEDLAANLWTNDLEVPGNGLDDDGNGYKDDVHGIDVLGDALTTPVNPQDDNGHGTHVAGTIGAAAGNGLGIAGVNWSVRLVPCKFLDRFGNGTTADAIRCLEYVRGLRDRGLDVIATNNSWGGGDHSIAMERAIAAQGDILFIASSGNDGQDGDRRPTYPAGYDLPNVLSVSATDHQDARPAWANYGRTTVAISAPGAEIVSLRAVGTDLYRDGLHFVPAGDPDARYYRSSGTSMAAPHVAGLAALLHSWDPTLDWRGVKNLILAGGAPVAALDGQTVTGRRIDALGSLTCAGRPLIALPPARQPFPIPAGASATLSVLSIDCRSPAGPVRATASDGTVVELRDDGVGPDQAAGDGLFTAAFAPAATVTHVTYASSAGTVTAPYFTIGRRLATANTHVPYLQAVDTLGGTAPFAWSVLSGSLPDGLRLDGATGAISGTPLRAGSFPFQLRAVDALGRASSAQLTLDVFDDLVVETAAFADLGPVDVTPQALAVDAAGNTVVAGYYVDPVTGRNDFAVRRYAPDGRLLWARNRVSGTTFWANNWAQGVAIDGAGAIYVAGGNPFGFLLADFIVVKYDADGQELWASSPDAATGKNPYAIAVDPGGDVVVAGTRWLGVNQNELFTAKYSPAGLLLWEQGLQVGLMDRAFGVATDQAGNAYVTGDSATVYQTSGASTGYTYAFLTAKYDPAGGLLWSRTEPRPEQSLGGALAVAVDQDGNSYVGGRFSATSIYKYGPDGAPLWSTSFFPLGNQFPQVDDLAIDGNGELLVVGHRGDLGPGLVPYFLAKLTPAGSVAWTRPLDGLYRDLAVDVAADGANAVHVSRPYEHGLLVSTFRELVSVVTTSPLPAGLRGSAYSAFMTARGGQGPYTWRVSAGALPAGLTLDPATGELRGVPTVGGTFTFTVAATGQEGSTGAAALTLPIDFIVLEAAGLPFGVTGKGYRQVLVARGTATPFSWRVVAGRLPPGLSLGSGSGAITGTPTTPGSFPFTVQVSDKEGHAARAALQIDVYAPVAVTSTRLAAGAVGVPYLTTLAATGGLPPYFWDLARGALPAGLSLDPSTGEISGVPVSAGEAVVTVRAIDQNGTEATRRLTLVVKLAR